MVLYVTRPRRDEVRIGRGLPSDKLATTFWPPENGCNIKQMLEVVSIGHVEFLIILIKYISCERFIVSFTRCNVLYAQHIIYIVCTT